MNRRDLLKAAIGAPLLKTLLPREARAQAAMTPPKRVVFWFQPGGVCHSQYHPAWGSTETHWTYDAAGDKHTLLPLLPYKDRTIHFDAQERVENFTKADSDWTKLTDADKTPFGLTDMAGCLGPDPDKPLDANGHPTRELTIGHGSPVSLMTARHPVKMGTSGGEAVWQPKGESIDVAIARHLGVQSVQLGVNAQGPGFNLSYKNDGERLPIIDDPRVSFERLFTGIPRVPGVDPARAALERKMRLRSAVFESSYARFRALEPSLQAPDRARLNQHFDAYKHIQDRLTRLPPAAGNQCHSPDAPAANLNLHDPLGLPARGRLMMDQMVLALACNVTPVITMSWTFAATNQVFSFLPGFGNSPFGPLPDGHHPLSHDSYGAGFQVVTADNQAAFEKKRRIERWYSEQLAYFLDALKAIPEADGSTLLDNTLVVALNEVSHSGAHNNSNLPIRLYGNLRGAFRTGRYVVLPQTPLNNLYVSIANAMGVPMTTFGEPRYDYTYTGPSTRWQWTAQKTAIVGPLAALS